MKTFVVKPHGSHTPSREEALAMEMGRAPWQVEEVPAWLRPQDLARKAKTSSLIIVFDSYFIYPPLAWHNWKDTLENEGLGGLINVPLGNQNPSWARQTGAPLYLTVRGLQEAALYRGPQQWLQARAEAAKEFCVVAVPVEKLLDIPEGYTLDALPRYWAETSALIRIFCRGWLHSLNAVREAGHRYDLLDMCDWLGMVLEAGCGSGLMAKACKARGWSVTWVGVDKDKGLLEQGRDYIDIIIQADLRSGLPLKPELKFDRIVCADVLEHLPYPWEFLIELRSLVKQKGLLVASVPNVGHWSVVEELLQGCWDEAPAGLFCVSHLRWGTRRSWQRWFSKAGWEVIQWRREIVPKPEPWLEPTNRLKHRWDWESLETLRYKILARPK